MQKTTQLIMQFPLWAVLSLNTLQKKININLYKSVLCSLQEQLCHLKHINLIAPFIKHESTQIRKGNTGHMIPYQNIFVNQKWNKGEKKQHPEFCFSQTHLPEFFCFNFSATIPQFLPCSPRISSRLEKIFLLSLELRMPSLVTLW